MFTLARTAYTVTLITWTKDCYWDRTPYSNTNGFESFTCIITDIITHNIVFVTSVSGTKWINL